MECGLLGRKLGHSYSPEIHRHLGNYRYNLFEVEPEDLECFLQTGSFTGLNVTMPYKKDVIPFLDELTAEARRLGAVNTIVRRDGKLIGHNTDYFGFQSMVAKTGLSPAGKKCLVLGSGGASNTVCAVLQELGAKVVVISRSGENNYENLSLHADASILVNTTPLGMYPNVGNSPVNLAEFPQLEGVLDVVYNPARTQLLLDAERRGLVNMNGLWMLIAQAKSASEWFTGRSVPDEVIEKIYRIMLAQMQNIVLIGMPGCGKSTIGRLLAAKTNKIYVDTDEEVVRLANKSIPAIFADDGEAVFRKLEKQVLQNIGKQSSLIIATGGGCVTREENYPLLHQNGNIFWIQRNLEHLATDGRPLSNSGNLAALYAQRESKYQQFADYAVNNNGSPEESANAILEVFP